MKKIHIISIILILFTTIACEKEIEFTGELQEKKIVLNSIAIADSILTAELYFSKFFLDNKIAFDTIKNAQVELYVNGSYKTDLTFQLIDVIQPNYYGSYIPKKSVYTSNFRPEPGDTLELRVNVEGYDKVSASTIVPQRVEIDKNDIRIRLDTLDYYESTYIDYNTQEEVTTYSGSMNIYYTVKLIDNANENNFYRIILKNSYGGYEYLESDDPIFSQSGDEGLFDIIEGSSTSNFTDESFNGENRSISFSHYYWFSSYENNNDKYLDFQQMSKEAYWYIKTSTASDFNEGNPFSEPVLTYSNVNGGIGVFGAFTKSKVPITVNIDLFSKK